MHQSSLFYSEAEYNSTYYLENHSAEMHVSQNNFQIWALKLRSVTLVAQEDQHNLMF